MRSIYLLAAITVHAATLASDATAGDAPVTVKVRLDRESYMAGEPILMLLDFQNRSDKLYVRISDTESGQTLDAHGGTEYDLKAVLKGPDGFVQTWRPRFRRNPGGHGVASVVLHPRGRKEHRIILTRVFQPSAPGDYQIVWKLDVPIEEDREYNMPGPPLAHHRVRAEGTTRIRVVAGNRAILEKRADALLAEAQEKKRHRVPSLFILATMPPDIAVPRFRRFFNLMNTKKANGQFEIAVHALVYVDTKEAVDLIAEVNKWTYQFDNVNHNAPPTRFDDEGNTIWYHSIKSLGNMYYMTNDPAMRRYIRKALSNLTPFEVVEPEKKPNIPST